MIIINLIIFFYLRGETMFCLIKNKKVKKKARGPIYGYGTEIIVVLVSYYVLFSLSTYNST